MEIQTYASKSTALRGAKRMGIDQPKIEQTESGRWIIKQVRKQRPKRVATGGSETKPDALQPITPLPGTVDLSNPESIVPKRTGVQESYRDLAYLAPARSTVKATKVFIWAFLDLNPTLGRKEAISLLVKNGCNMNTSRTQYELWWASKKRE